MPSKPGVRTLRLPAPDLNTVRILRSRQRSRDWFRVHQSQHGAINFALNAAHRFSHADCPYHLLYLAADVGTCLFERFGDTAYDREKAVALSLWEAHSASVVKVPALQVCDLTKARTLSALKVDLGALMHHDLAVPQAWGVALQKHPANFQGIKFKSRFNGKSCLALFRRDGIESALRERLLDKLPNNDAAVDWLEKYKVSLY